MRNVFTLEIYPPQISYEKQLLHEKLALYIFPYNSRVFIPKYS